MVSQSLESRVDRLEQHVEHLETLPGQVARLESQFLQFRGEVRGEFSTVRVELHVEMRAMEDRLRTEMRALNHETRTFMRVLHEEVLDRIKMLGDARATARARSRRKKSR